MNLAPIDTECPLCLDNDLLRGGELFATSEHWYIYVFRSAEDGSVQRAMINPRQHYVDPSQMPLGAGDEYLTLLSRVRHELFVGRDFNVYSNEGGEGSETAGWTAGRRIAGHLHVHVVYRPQGTPSSGMGLGLLMARFDGLVRSLDEIIATCDPVTAAKLQEVVRTATVL